MPVFYWESVSLSVYWILLALCSVLIRAHVFVCSLRPSSAVWSGVQMVELGPAEGECLYLSLFLFLSYILLSSAAFSVRFHLPVTSLAASTLSSLHLLKAILGRAEFSALYFSSPFFFVLLSGLSAATRCGGFGMKCLLTEPCAPELR